MTRPSVSAHIFSTVAVSSPMIAAMRPGRASQHFCISTARVETSLRASSKLTAPQATRAENSPRECPPTMSGRGRLSLQRAVHTECRNTAGCVTLVARRSSALPPNIMSVMRKPSISSAFSIISLALLLDSYKSFPIPENWAPCPGNTNAVFISEHFSAKIGKISVYLQNVRPLSLLDKI